VPRRLALFALCLPLLAGSAIANPSKAPAPVPVADLAAIRAAITAPGATAVLVNVWATWCDACREELPDLLRFYRSHRAAGLRLLLVSADDEDQGREVARFLAPLLAVAGAADARAVIKHGDDLAFVNAFDPAWSGALPATFLFDAAGKKRRLWSGPVAPRALEEALAALGPNQKSPQKGTP
jgi:peroxiredoxin